jgi:hypothetical protein
MATYVNNLRLKEITTGDESGTWGTSTNTNLELIADAFGYSTESLASDADATITMADGAADGIRALYVKITSGVSLTATRTVTIAPNTVSKVWIIENATTGSQSITIAQGSGATVTIANGSKVMVYTDGAGAGAAVTNANPSAATGGTVTSVGGTGTVNGITLTGTVTSSGNLTLGGTLSGVNLTTQVTGTLPVANGGTGATTLTANNVILGNGTSAVQVVAPGTSGNVLTSDGTTWSSTAPSVTLAANNAFTGANTFYNATGQTFGTATSTQDGIVVKGRAGGSSSYRLSFAPDTLSASRTVTFPDGGGNYTVGYKNIPAVGTKTSSYTLAVADVGKYVQVGSGGSITVPDATFSEGDVVSIFNNTSGSITITCSITTCYKGGENVDISTATLNTRGVATVFFISSTVAVITGNLA